MKKVFLILLLATISTSTIFAQANSSPTGNTVPFTQAAPEVHKGPAGACQFLVFMDGLPWNSSAIQTILTNNGESFVVKGSADMATEDFSLYDVIIIASDQPISFHNNFVAQFTKFVNFVTAGGRLEVHAATCGWFSPCGYSVQLPGGVFTVEQYDAFNVLVTPAHPIVAGIPDPFQGSWASHGVFSNLVAGTTIITAAQSNNLPTTIQYHYGSGTVTATTCTYEYGYNAGESAGQMLINNLNYSCEFVPIPATPVAPWALGIGIILIACFTAFRFYRHS
jgi:hypothetical protein